MPDPASKCPRERERGAHAVSLQTMPRSPAVLCRAGNALDAAVVALWEAERRC